MGRIRTFLAGGIAGAIAAYFLDPNRGRTRRIQTLDQAQGFVRIPEDTDPDDLKLKSRIESEVFATGRFPKSRVNITVVDGLVELRGELPTPEDIRAFEHAVSLIQGVGSVHNMMHLPRTPAPNKQEAREAG